MMKKVLLGVIFSVLLLTFMAVPAKAEYEIRIMVDDKFVSLDEPGSAPFVDENNRTQVPIRFVSEKLGAKVKWDNSTQTVTIERNGYSAKLTVGKRTAIVNGNEVTFDSSVFIKNERTFVPLRFVGEVLGTKVYWDGRNQQVSIRTYEKLENSNGFTFPLIKQIGVSADDMSNQVSMTVYVNNPSKLDEIQVDEVKYILKQKFSPEIVNDAIIALKQQMENNVSGQSKTFTEGGSTITISASNSLTVDIKVNMFK